MSMRGPMTQAVTSRAAEPRTGLRLALGLRPALGRGPRAPRVGQLPRGGIRGNRGALGAILVVLVLAVVGLTSEARAQGTAADYERAAHLGQRFNRGAAGQALAAESLAPHWIESGPERDRFWFIRPESPPPDGTTRADGRRYVLVDPANGRESPLFDHAWLAARLAERLGKPVGERSLPLERVDVLPEGVLLLVDGIDAPLLVSGGGGAGDGATGASRPSLADAPEGLGRRFVLALRPEANASGDNRRVRSRNGNDETSLRFVNRTPSAVRIVWVDASGAEREYATLPPGGSHRQHTFAGHAWKVLGDDRRSLGWVRAVEEPTIVVIGGDAPPAEPRTGSAAGPTSDDSAEPPAPSPAAPAAPSPPSPPPPRPTVTATIEGGNLVLRTGGGQEVYRSTDGTDDCPYVEPIHWSPDRSKLLVFTERKAQSHPVHIVESSPRDQVQPKLRTFEYLKPGDRIGESSPRMIDVAAGRAVPLSGVLPEHPWSLDHIHWRPDSSRVDLLDNERGHQVMRVLSIDAASGESKAIVDEHVATFFDYAGKLYLEHLDDTDELLWTSERDGWNHLYLVDRATGQVKRQLTKGPWVVRDVERLDRDRRELLLRVGGIDPEQDPYHEHWIRVSLDGGEPVRLTDGDGTHRLHFSPSGAYAVDTWSRVDLAPVSELRDGRSGRRILELARGDTSALVAAGWQAPERFVAKGRDGTTDIWGVLWKPTNFDPSRRYPVIESIYAGPQDSFVPKSFRVLYPQSALAELGFVVVQIDGMGTSNRSKAFHDVCWKNLKDAGFPDRVAWIRAAASTRPWMDLSRVGIYGGSAGGQNALRGLLDYPDFYKVGVADCGCHDNRMDKIWWNELWMGWPVDESYATSSNVVDAHKLEGKLLLIVGELDQNVDPASTMQVVDALVRADKDFDLLVLPGAGHGAAQSPYGARRQMDFFVRHLLGVEPRGRSPETPNPAG